MAAIEGPITNSNIRRLKVLFSPKDTEESAYVQERLFALGIKWADGVGNVSHLDETVSKGIVVMDGAIYYRSDGDTVQYDTALTEQLGSSYVSEERRFLMNEFARIHARLDRIEAKVDRMHDEIFPPAIDKKKLPKPPST